MLDERDLEIVSALREDARATYADVATRVLLSRLVQQLQEKLAE